FYGGQIVPKKYLESVGNDAFNAKPVGTGPVRFASWVKDDRLTLDANPDYWGGKPDFDRLIVRSIPETAPRIAALLKGEVDIITQVPPDQEERIIANPATRVDGALYAGLYVLAVNSKRPPLDNPLVKQALSLAIDRELIVKELWKGRGIVPNGPIAKGDSFFDPKLPPLAYNPKEARERLKKAGYKGEEIFIETTVAYVSQDKAMSEAIAAMWKDVGVNVKVEVIEYSVRAQKNREKSFKGMYWSDPTSTLADPDGMMWRLLGPGGPQDYWRESKFDEMGAAARFSVDEKFRAEAYSQMTKVFLEHFPGLPVIQPYEDYGLQKYVEFTPNPNQQFEIRRFNFKFRRAYIRPCPLLPWGAGRGEGAFPMRGVFPFIVQRLFRALIALWLVSTVVFVVMRLSGDPVPLLLPPDAPHSEILRVRRGVGVGKPLPGALRCLPVHPRAGRFRPLDPLPPARLRRGARLPAGHDRAGPHRLRARGGGRGAARDLLRDATQHDSGPRRDGLRPGGPGRAHLFHRHPAHPAAFAEGRSLPDLGPRRLAEPGAPRADARRVHDGLHRAAHSLRGPRGVPSR